MPSNQADTRAAIRMAIEEAEKGAFISQEAMDAWVASWDTDAKNAPPEPDVLLDQKNNPCHHEDVRLATARISWVGHDLAQQRTSALLCNLLNKKFSNHGRNGLH